MNSVTVRPCSRRAALGRRWAVTLGCLLLMVVGSGADELYDFVATDLKGTPALVTYRTARRSVTRSRRRASYRRQQAQSRRVSLRRERYRLVRTRKRLRVRDSSRTRIAAARATSTESARADARGGGASGSRRTSRPAATSGSQAKGTQLPRPARQKGVRQSRSPNRLPPPALPAVLARRPRQPAGEQGGAGDEVRQNLSLAFVTPRNAPAVGVRLVARVVPAEGKELLLPNLTTDTSGRVKLQNIALPAAIDLDFPGETSLATGAPRDWDFADPEQATLLLENPVGSGRAAFVADRIGVAAARRRVRLFEGQLAPIVLERQVIDLAVAAPSGSQVSSPALEVAGPTEAGEAPASSSLLVPESGRLEVRLPREALEEGPVPIRVARDLPGGEAEAVIHSYPTDPYETNTVQSPPLRLARLSQFEVAGRVGVMGTSADVATRLGDLRGPANAQDALGVAVPLDDGSEWWNYPGAGIAFKMRLAPDARPGGKAPAMLVERVHLFRAGAGSLGTISVGSTVQQMRASLGAPQAENVSRTPADELSAPGQIDTWLDGGLRVCHDQSRVLWLEATRPSGLLTGGTTAFVRRARARVFVESFQGHPKINLLNAGDVRKYLQQAHSVATAGSPESADLVLKARVSEFKESTNAATGRYNCVTRLRYSLFDTGLGRFVAEDKQAQGTATVDSAQEADDARAASAMAAFNALVREVNRAADFSVRVTDIDYDAGTLRLNAGRAQGLRASQSDPDDFQITVAGAALPRQDEERSSRFYTARVIEVGEDWAVCRLMRINHYLTKRGEGVKEEPARDMVRRLPDPATGLIAAQSWRPFPTAATISESNAEWPGQMAKAAEG